MVGSKGGGGSRGWCGDGVYGCVGDGGLGVRFLGPI